MPSVILYRRQNPFFSGFDRGNFVYFFAEIC